MVVVGTIFLSLGFWARRSPLPAAITGLVIYVTLVSIDAIAAPEMVAKGLIIKVIIVAVLASAIQAGVRHRKLRSMMQNG